MTKANRRRFLQLAGFLGALAPSEVIARAVAVPASRSTGTLADVEHVVILMQENRSFDHYFGALRGVRGFDDPRPISLPGGKPVWAQPRPGAGGGHVLPFRLNGRTTSAECMASLDHSWKGSHAAWKHHDAWIGAKGEMTMGHFAREDLPFYYALADAFTICDAYHCSIFGPTSPNRNFLFTGTSGLSAGYDGALVVKNAAQELSEIAYPSHDNPAWPGLEWTTYAERLQAAGVSWKVYQEYDNYGDNALAYFKAFRGADVNPVLTARGRGGVDGSNAQNAKTSRGEHLIAELARDVRTGALPQVSWIVAPYICSEHPSACPSVGEHMTAGLLNAIVSTPEVWAKTVFILNYDENDGFFDHMPPPVPAPGAALGASTMSTDGENYHGEPVGLGPRVPMIVVSPWSTGGFVNSELLDHTSVLRFLEQRFGVVEPNISPWRRAVCGDLTSVFDFTAPADATAPRLPDVSGYLEATAAACKLTPPHVPADQAMPRQERGQRPARALPYDLRIDAHVDAASKSVRLEFINEGRAGACFSVRSAAGGQGPWFYAVEAGKRLAVNLPIAGGAYDLTIDGPNGLRQIARGALAGPGVEAVIAHDPAHGQVTVRLRNDGPAARIVAITPRDYLSAPTRSVTLAPGAGADSVWDIGASAHWYDLAVTSDGDPGFLRRFAGHVETGRPSLSDPAIGRG